MVHRTAVLHARTQHAAKADHAESPVLAVKWTGSSGSCTPIASWRVLLLPFAGLRMDPSRWRTIQGHPVRVPARA
jgi:hypothetical protein